MTEYSAEETHDIHELNRGSTDLHGDDLPYHGHTERPAHLITSIGPHWPRLMDPPLVYGYGYPYNPYESDMLVDHINRLNLAQSRNTCSRFLRNIIPRPYSIGQGSGSSIADSDSDSFTTDSGGDSIDLSISAAGAAASCLRFPPSRDLDGVPQAPPPSPALLATRDPVVECARRTLIEFNRGPECCDHQQYYIAENLYEGYQLDNHDDVLATLNCRRRCAHHEALALRRLAEERELARQTQELLSFTMECLYAALYVQFEVYMFYMRLSIELRNMVMAYLMCRPWAF